MKRKSALFFAAILGAGVLFSVSAGNTETVLGIETAAEERVNGDFALVPAAYILFSGSRFPSEEASLFLDAYGHAGWDTAGETAVYDFSVSGGFSLRKTPFFAGLSLATRAVDTAEDPGEWVSSAEATLSWTRAEVSLYAKPGISFTAGPRDAFSASFEPGLSGLVFPTLVGTAAVRGGLTRFLDGGEEFFAEPKAALDWYPDAPFSVSAKGSWERVFDRNAGPLGNTAAGEVSLLLYAARGLTVAFRFPAEREYDGTTGETVLRLEPFASARISPAGSDGGTDLVFSAGWRTERFFDADERKDGWFLRLGLEKAF